jgi:23S rRNA pseudouridine2605 synthase
MSLLQRLQKILAARGICSRRKAEEMITAGRVSVNGAVANLGDSADPETDEIRLDGDLLPTASDYVYILLHKPRGFVTTASDEKGRPNVIQLVDVPQRVYPVGRLDMDSEGLLLLTNDGEFANKVMHPKAEVDKIYEVWVNGFTEGGLAILKQPMQIDGYTIRTPKIKVLGVKGDGAHLEITIHEGRNRQVRRMCSHAGMTVTRLRRIGEGSLRLGNLEKGKWRYLTLEEIRVLMK